VLAQQWAAPCRAGIEQWLAQHEGAALLASSASPQPALKGKATASASTIAIT